mgnify:CR=1 FL=1
MTTTIMVAFAPIIVFFQMSGDNYYFLQLLHVAIFIFAGIFGMKIVMDGLQYAFEKTEVYPKIGVTVLKSLQHIIQLVNAAHDFQESLDIMVCGVKDALETQICTIFLFDRKHQEFLLAASSDPISKDVKQIKVPAHQGLVGFVADREEPLNIKNSTEHPNNLLMPTIKEEMYKGYLATTHSIAP